VAISDFRQAKEKNQQLAKSEPRSFAGRALFGVGKIVGKTHHPSSGWPKIRISGESHFREKYKYLDGLHEF